MKPNFALSLSYEGIRLLHRTGSGPASVWTLVGEVAIDAPDLAGQLAMLRKTGLALDPQGLRTKLLIPNDQIKYLSINTTRADDEDVRRALDGTTPYPVSDLMFDYVRGGGRTYIAAIARETLAEAEAFAAEHRFGPVSFAGVPAPFTYVGEPFFGQTSIADRLLGVGQRVERDDMPVACQPKIRLPEKVPATTATSGDRTTPGPAQIVPDTETAKPDLIEPDVRAATPLDQNLAGLLPPLNLASLNFAPGSASLSGATGASNSGLPDLPGQFLDDTPSDEAPYIDVPSVPDGELTAEPSVEMAGPPNPAPDVDPAVNSEPLPLDFVPPKPVVAKPPLVPEPVFASRGRTLRADPADVPAMHQPLPPPPGSRSPRADDGPDPVFSRRTEPPVMKPMAPSPVLSGPIVKAPPLSPTLPDMIAETPTLTTVSGMTAPRLTGAARQAQVGPGFDVSGSEVPAPRAFSAKMPAPAAAPAVTGLSSATRSSDAVAATVIPFRPNPEPADQNAATPVSIQTVTLTPGKPALATTTVTAPILDPGKPGSFAIRHGGKVPPLHKTAAELGLVPSTTGNQPHPVQPVLAKPGIARAGGRRKPRYLALILTLVLLAFLAAVAAWASYIGPERLAGLFSRAAPTEMADVPTALGPLSVTELSASALVPPQDPVAVAVAMPTPDAAPEIAAVPGLVLPDSTADTVALVPPETTVDVPQQPVTSAAAAAGTVVSPAEAERIYAATGVWLRAPRLPLIPTAEPLGSLGLATLDSGVAPRARPVLPALAGAAPDQSMLTPIDPPAPGTVFQRDARGFVLATPEGTLTPDGILVFAGAPALIPPNRPGTPEPVAVVQAPPRIIAASAPPLAPRPATVADALAAPLVETGATAGAVGLNSLGALVRPLQRPDNLTPETAQPGILDQPGPLVDAPVLAAYAGPAPQLRPVGLTPETVALPDAPAIPNAPTDPNLAIEDTVAAILAATPPEPITSDSPLAIASARIPQTRPQNFAEVVASAQQRSAPVEPQNPSLAVIDPPPEPPAAEPAPEPAPEPTPEQPVAQPELLPESAIADETVAPSGPIPGGVAANATLAEAMDLRAVNLIGVFGRPNDRRALVRLANGRYVRVGVGDSLDGGQVAAIGDNALNYVKRGQTITIAIPNG